MNHPLRDLPKDVRGHIYSFLTVPITQHELLSIRQRIKENTAIQMIDLCREMGFIEEVRGCLTGEYAHPSNLYFFWIRPKHSRHTYMVARTRHDPLITSGISKRCLKCMSFNCVRHQLRDQEVETYLMDVLLHSSISITAHRDVFTNKQYMDVVPQQFQDEFSMKTVKKKRK